MTAHSTDRRLIAMIALLSRRSARGNITYCRKRPKVFSGGGGLFVFIYLFIHLFFCTFQGARGETNQAPTHFIYCVRIFALYIMRNMGKKRPVSVKDYLI